MLDITKPDRQQTLPINHTRHLLRFLDFKTARGSVTFRKCSTTIWKLAETTTLKIGWHKMQKKVIDCVNVVQRS